MFQFELPTLFRFCVVDERLAVRLYFRRKELLVVGFVDAVVVMVVGVVDIVVVGVVGVVFGNVVVGVVGVVVG